MIFIEADNYLLGMIREKESERQREREKIYKRVVTKGKKEMSRKLFNILIYVFSQLDL